MKYNIQRETTNACNIFVRNSKGNKPLGRATCKYRITLIRFPYKGLVKNWTEIIYKRAQVG